eukprot:UN26728
MEAFKELQNKLGLTGLLCIPGCGGCVLASLSENCEHNMAILNSPFEILDDFLCGWEGRLGNERSYIYTTDESMVLGIGESWEWNTCGSGGDHKSIWAPSNDDIQKLGTFLGLQDLLCIPGCGGCVLGSMSASCEQNMAMLNSV